jgi:hypothetical protein
MLKFSVFRLEQMEHTLVIHNKEIGKATGKVVTTMVMRVQGLGSRLSRISKPALNVHCLLCNKNLQVQCFIYRAKEMAVTKERHFLPARTSYVTYFVVLVSQITL